jgi:hypothetical protein
MQGGGISRLCFCKPFPAWERVFLYVFFHLLELVRGENLSIGKINKFKEIFSTKLYAGFSQYIVFTT